ncbi:MIB [Mytilus coruscus]|uniref:MIB n=1 Tax=Mytilus coruscus TaxID=42192 RepID=A0A6J8A638_MYTCO|nr:MIB [Mytilus coruscus]
MKVLKYSINTGKQQMIEGDIQKSRFHIPRLRQKQGARTTSRYASHSGVSKLTTPRLMSNLRQTWSSNDSGRSGRPREMTLRQDRRIRFTHLRDRFLPPTITVRQTPGRYNLRISTQTVRNRLREAGVKHTHVQCDGCDMYPLRGIRWKCMICGDYDLCTDCYMNNEHDLSHIFKRKLSTDSKGEQMPPRENQEFTYALGIQPNAIVHLYSDTKHKGRVERFIENTIETYRSDAKVNWNDNLKGSYRVGRNGKCDLKFTEAAKGPMYYEDHLPIATFEVMDSINSDHHP